jgi:tetratricopeptide (TPR) repeat protein
LRTTTLLLVALAATALPVSDLAAREPQHTSYKAGDFVVVTRQAELKVENKAVDTVEPGVLMGVDQVSGDWLWVSNNKPGWLNSANVMPAEKSVEYFTAAIRRSPGDARLFARRGVARALNHDFQAALKDYQEAIRLKPSEAVYYGDRGCFYMAIGDFDRAIADFAEEIKRIDSEEETRREIRLQWLNQRLAEAQSLKSTDGAVTLGEPK